MVSQSFLAFGDILELHRKFLELSGGINRIFELEELLDAAQSGISFLCSLKIYFSPIFSSNLICLLRSQLKYFSVLFGFQVSVL